MTKRAAAWLELLSLLGLFAALLAVTWMRWPDALVDFWRNLYIPWRLSEGALLYVDVADWYGPLATLVAAAAFSLFGPGLDTLVALNALVALGCLFTLRAVLLHVGDRTSAWVGSAVFVLVFCFGQYTMLGNYNFLTPYTSQATWGFFGVLLTLEGALSNTKEESPRGWLLAGAGLAIAWLSKAETLLACAVVLLALTALRRRVPPLRFFLGFGLVSVPVWLLLTAQGGVVYALRAFNQVITFTLSSEVRATLAAVPIFNTDLGTDAPWLNLAAHASRGAVLLAVMAAVAFAPQAFRRGPRVTVVLGLLLAVALVALTDWLRVGRALLMPALLTAGVSSAALFKGQKKLAPLWLFSLAALAMLARMALNVRVFHYGFTMAVLASMLVVHLLVFEAPRLRSTPPAGLSFAVSVLVLAGSARLTVHTLEQYAAKKVTVGTGRDAFTAFSPEHQRHPALVNDMLAALEHYTPAARTLVVFPDSAAVSYLSRRPSPIPEFEFNPVSLGFSGADRVLARLQANPPDVVLLCSYDLRSHGTPFFGASEASGQAIAAWVKAHYVKVAAGAPGPLSVTGHTWDLMTLRTPVVTP